MQQQRLASAGDLDSAIAAAAVRVHRHELGHGPARARAFFSDNAVVVVLQGALTKGELTLVANGGEESALEIRAQFNRAMRRELVAAVEELTGASVVAFLAASHAAPDVVVQVFMLDRAVECEAGEDAPSAPDAREAGMSPNRPVSSKPLRTPRGGR